MTYAAVLPNHRASAICAAGVGRTSSSPTRSDPEGSSRNEFAAGRSGSHPISTIRRQFGAAVTTIAAAALTIASPAAANEDDWAEASDVIRTALVIAAIGAPLVDGDTAGAIQAGASVGTAFLVTEGLKETIPSLRPNGRDNRSFPSGHTSSSFAAAATITERHGLGAGIPAHIAAAFVGLARIEAREHRLRDVLVGAAIGEAAGLLITRRPDSRVAIIPWGDTTGGGVTVAARF